MGLFRKLFSRTNRLASDIEKRSNDVNHLFTKELSIMIKEAVARTLEEINADLKKLSKNRSSIE